jgi:L-Ala-D/L-Glu epimerase
MITWEITDLPLTLKYEWKIARNASSAKHNLLITIKKDNYVGRGEIAPNVRYGENPDLIKAQFHALNARLVDREHEHPEEFALWLKKQAIAKSLKNGLETAFVHLYCTINNLSIANLLNIQAPEELITTSYTLPIMPASDIGEFIETHNLTRFDSLKIKVNRETASDLVQETLLHYKGPVRIDGNETWINEKEVLSFLDNTSLERVEFLEQPLPENCLSEYKKLKQIAPIPILLDESITDNPNFEELTPQCHGINMKMMKAGGYYNGLHILQEAQKHELKTMIGCMIETTLGIFSAIHLSNGINYLDLDGFFVIDNDPFNLILEKEGKLIINKGLF